VIGDGGNNGGFRGRFSSFFQVAPDRVFLFSKGRVALYAVLKAMGVGRDDEVILPGYTCVMVPSAAMFLGAKCRYVDIEPRTYNLDPALLDRHYTARTRALVVQHTYGISQRMEPVMEWAASRGLPVIEDCCHAFGSAQGGRLCGAFGAASFFSGQWNKPFSTGLGGMLLVNDGKLRHAVEGVYGDARFPGRAESLRLRAQILAFNALVTPRTAGLAALLYRGLSRANIAEGSSSNAEFRGLMPPGYLKRMAAPQEREGERCLADIGARIAHRKRLAAFYSERLPGPGFKALPSRPGHDDVLLRYPVRVANKREVLGKALRKGVEIGSWFEVPLHPSGIDMAYFGYREGLCPESEKACRETVNLPLHKGVSEKEASRVLDFLSLVARPA